MAAPVFFSDSCQFPYLTKVRTMRASVRPTDAIWDAAVRPAPGARQGGDVATQGFSGASFAVSFYGPSGEGGIRTREGASPLPVFETGPFGRSGTSPKRTNG